MRYFDAFSGIGGFALPLSEFGHECVGFSETDPWAARVYRSHFPSHHPYGDITRLDPAALPDFDLFCGGFPCQAFSVAGKRRGFLDTRGTLFFDVCRVAKEKRPRLLLLENVKGLLHHAGGHTFRFILAALDDLGYDAEWQVCNSRDFGVPQNRERVYIVGHLRGTPGPQVFPLEGGEDEHREEDEDGQRRFLRQQDLQGRGSNADERIEHRGETPGRDRPQEPARDYQTGRWFNKEGGVTIDDPAPTLHANGETELPTTPVTLKYVGSIGTPRKGVEDQAHLSRAHKQPQRVYDPSGLAPCLSSGEMQGRYNIALPCAVRSRDNEPTIEVRTDGVANALRASEGSSRPMVMYPGHAVNETAGVARTLKAGVHGVPGGDGLVRTDQQIRRLTPIECERLQGFQDGWTAFGVNETGERVSMSDTQRYKMCGNAVTTSVVRAIVVRLA